MKRPIQTLARITLTASVLSGAAHAQEPLRAGPLAWGDQNGDARLDVFRAGPAGGDSLLLCREDGGFDDRSDLLGAERRSRAGLWLDVDHDRRQDLVLLGADGGLTLLRGSEDGGLIEAGESAGLDEFPAAHELRAFDYDADGRVDLSLRTADLELLLHNEGSGVFALALELPVAPEASVGGLPGPGAAPPPGAPGGAGAAPAGPPPTGNAGGGLGSAGTRSPRTAGSICAGSLEDFALPGMCLTASSVPTMGMLYPLGTELFIDSFTGYVGIGTTTPIAELDVTGAIRTDGFVMPTGAGTGRVLTSDDMGIAAWAPNVHNTLDMGYDEGGPGMGRKITADAMAVRIEGAGDDALQLTTNGSSDSLQVEAASDPGGTGIRVSQIGAGDGIFVDYTGSKTGVRVVANDDDARAGEFRIVDASNDEPVMQIVHDGKGIGIDSILTNIANDAEALSGVTVGTGQGVYGRTGPVPAEGEAAAKAGVAGEAADQIGVSGWSDTSTGVQGESKDGDGVEGRSVTLNGVKGSTAKVGSWLEAAGGAVGGSIEGGVLGVGADVDTVDNFAVVGDARGYGVGVFGLGGADEGHGVIGLSSMTADGDKTITGVRGITREPGNDHWSLKDLTAKVKVGVYGQAKAYAGVWGESTERVGVAGSGGTQVPNGHLPTGKVGVYGQAEVKVIDPATQPNDGGVIGLADTLVGVHGWSDDSTGVRGVSKKQEGVIGLSYSDDRAFAGVQAIGQGADKAAALNIDNGAITVSGASRPAGIVPVGGWAPIESCEGGCADCPHKHIIGWQAVGGVANDLVEEDSIIIATVEADSLGEGFTVHVAGKMKGGFSVVVTSTGDPTGFCQQPMVPAVVHYLVIDPL